MTPIHVFGVCFLPESSPLIGQFRGCVLYFYVTDDGRTSNLQKWFSDQNIKLLVLVGLMTNHDHFFSQYFFSVAVPEISQDVRLIFCHRLSEQGSILGKLLEIQLVIVYIIL